MFQTGRDPARAAKAIALKSARRRHRDTRGEKRVFARPFRHPAPAGIAADIDHGRENLMQPFGGGLGSGLGGGGLDQGHVPATGQPDSQRKNGAMAVDHILGEEQRDRQPRPRKRAFLHGARGGQ